MSGLDKLSVVIGRDTGGHFVRRCRMSSIPLIIWTELLFKPIAKSRRKRGRIRTLNTHLHNFPLLWSGTYTSIKKKLLG